MKNEEASEEDLFSSNDSEWESAMLWCVRRSYTLPILHTFENKEKNKNRTNSRIFADSLKRKRKEGHGKRGWVLVVDNRLTE